KKEGKKVAKAKPVKVRKTKTVKKVVAKTPAPKPAKAVKAAPTPKLPPIVKMPDEKAYELFKAAKIPIVPYAFVKREKDLPAVLKKIKFPVVMKVSGPGIIHKTDVGGIIKNINSEAAAADAFKKLMAIKGAEKVIVQKQVEGLELIVGAKSDPQFGYIVSVGLGGIYVEVLKDVTFRVAPITTADASAMVRELKGFEILAGARGTAPINFAALYDVLTKVSRLIGTAKLKELDINPLFCTPDGCWAADIRAIKQ
ncbi:MAG: acetate--CoA ligase family protein, partial [Candidatus Aenigmatarchaeota archaeon]